MTQRYFSLRRISGDQAEIEGQQAHHLSHVMRAAVGDQVILFDGSGREFTACVKKISRSQVTLSIESSIEVDRELGFELVLAVALPKGDRQRWLIEKAVELGVTRVVPLITSRGVAQPTKSAAQRLGRWVVEASKQCGRNVLLQIDPPQPFANWIEQYTDEAIRLLAHPGEKTFPQIAPGVASQPARRVLLTIGPEGGFTEEEVGLAKTHRWQCVGLGPRIMRVETAAIFLIGGVLSQRGEWN